LAFRLPVSSLEGPDLKVQFYGVRGSTPTPGPDYARYGGNTSCVVLTVDGEDPIALDAGTGLRAWGDSLDSGAPLRATALVSHLHLDHIQGLPFFTPLFRPGAQLEMYGPEQEIGSFEKAITRVFRPPLHPVRPSEIHGSISFHQMTHGEVMIGSAHVTVRPVPHLGRTIGYRVEHGGSSVAYVSDHQAPSDQQTIDTGVLELASDVDLLIHDAQYTPSDWETKSDWGHCTVAYAVQVARTAGARKLAMFHHDPCRTDDAVDGLVAEARVAAGDHCDVIAASEGLVIELSAPSPVSG